MVEVCHEGCKGVCERGPCEIEVKLNEKVSARKMASLIVEMLSSEEIEVVNEPKGRLINALLEVAKWLGVEVKRPSKA